MVEDGVRKDHTYSVVSTVLDADYPTSFFYIFSH